MANRRPAPRPGSVPRVPELSRQCRIRSHLTQKCSRKELDPGNYTMSDCLRGLSASRLGTEIVGPSAALNPLEQQVRIVEALKQRFESTLFDIRALVQADLFDNELDAAEEINNKGFQRGAGAIAGVVLEGHLATVCTNHKIAVP